MRGKKEFLVIMIILLFAGGLLFRDTKPLFAAFSLSLMLLTDLFILHKKIEEAIKEFEIVRIPDKKIVLINNNIVVKLELNIKIPEGTKIQIEDLIPKGSVVTSESVKTHVLWKSGKYSINYGLICLAHGINVFEGVKINIFDSFFSKHLIFERKYFTLPEIKVYPKPSFIKNKGSSFYGRNTNKTTLIKGKEVKGLREYNSYDDIRLIDWKASAKYDKLFVKEYSGLEGNIKTIFIDLPDFEDYASDKKLEKLKGFIGSILINHTQIRECNLIIISGPNLKNKIKSENFHEDIINIINNLNPSIRDSYLYKYSPKNYANNKMPQNLYTNSLAEKAGYFFRIKSPHLFEEQIYNVLENLNKSEEISIITLPNGDISHLKIIARLARLKNIKSGCFIPGDENKKYSRTLISSCGFDEVNII